MAEQFTNLESFYSSTLAQSISASATTIVVATAPVSSDAFLVIEKNTANEEIIKMTGRTGTSLTVVRGLAVSGSTETDAGNGVSHPAGSSIEITNVHYYIKQIQAKNSWSYRGDFADLATIQALSDNVEAGDVALARDTGFLYYYNGSAWATVSGGSTPADASTSTKGITKLSTAPASATNPIAVGDNDTRVPMQDENDLLGDLLAGTYWYGESAVGTDSYAITPSPALPALVAGARVRFKADVANTGACSLDVSSLGAATIKKHHDQDLDDNDIEIGSIVEVVHDGTNWQMVNPSAIAPGKSVDVQFFLADNTWTKPAGAKTVEVYAFGAGGGGSGGAVLGGLNASRGGAGGGGGGFAYKKFSADALSATEAVVVGTGGNGGAGAVETGTTNTNGSNGSGGGTSSFGSFVIALGGSGGAGGTPSTGASAGGGGGQTNGDITQAGGAGGNATSAGVNSSTLISPRGGGGAGESSGNPSSGAGSAGGAFTGSGYTKAGGSGDTDADLLWGGVGGNGGTSRVGGTTTGDAGGVGGFPGGGGGGGGGAGGDAGGGTNTSGAGGDGADGLVVVITHF